MDIDRVDPDLREATLKLPVPDPSKRVVRAAIRLATRIMPVPVPRAEAVTVTTAKAGGVRLRLYQPEARVGDGALLWVHGGGLLFGDARQDEALCSEAALRLGIPVISVNYRFAPEHPFPAAHDDVRIGWQWVQDHAGDLGVNPARVIVGGESAGGGLAASLVQRLQDERGTQPIGQWLFAPMIDDRTAADESLDALEHWVWNNRANRAGWSGYLGGEPGAAEVPTYAAAARRVHLEGLPPTFIAVGDIELFFAEDVDYAERLSAAGVDVEVDIIPGAPHGFENWARAAKPSRDLIRRAHEWLRRIFANER